MFGRAEGCRVGADRNRLEVVLAPPEPSGAPSGTTGAPAWLDADGVDVLDVEVTNADINQGRHCLPSLCMVAVATRRQLGLHERRHFAWTRAWDDRRVDNRLWVGSVPGDDRWRINYQGVEYLLPAGVGERIVAWDAGSPTEPFRFQAVRLPERR